MPIEDAFTEIPYQLDRAREFGQLISRTGGKTLPEV